MGGGMVPHLNTNVAPTHLVGHSRCCAGTKERVENKVSGLMRTDLKLA